MKNFLVETGHKVGVRIFACLNSSIVPRTTPTGWFTKRPKVIGLAKPKSGLWLSCERIPVKVARLELHGRRLVTAHDEHTSPGTEVRNHAKMSGYRTNTPD